MSVEERVAHHFENALVPGLIEVVLEDKHHDHVRPQVVLADQIGRRPLAPLARAEPAVRLLARDRPLDPDLRLLHHLLYLFKQMR